MSLNSLKSDFLEMLKLQGEISKYSEMIMHHINICDKRNYDLDKCDKINKKISKLEKRFYALKDMWFD